MKGRSAASPVPVHESLTRLDFSCAAATAIGAFALYALTACRTLSSGDSAELAAAAGVFGVPHPPGYPLYTIVTGVVVRAFGFLDLAFAASLASSLYAALAVGLVLLVSRRLGASGAGSLFAAVALAAGSTLWSVATVAEVYSLDLLLLLAACLAALEASERASRRSWFVAAIVVGLWVGYRPINLLVAPWLVLLVSARRPLREMRGVLGPLVAGLFVSALVYVYLPLASARDPAIDIGDPEHLAEFWTVVSGAPYRRHFSGFSLSFAFAALRDWVGSLPRELGIAAGFALVGGWIRIVRGSGARRIALALLLLVVGTVAVASAYHVLDANVYFLPALAAGALLAAPGADALLEPVRSRFGARAAVVTGAVLVGAAALHLPYNFPERDLHAHRLVRRYAEDLLASIAPNAVVVVEGDTAIHALWYLQAIEHRGRDVIVLSPGHVHPWYVRQLRARYPDDPWPDLAPDGSQLEFTRQALDRLGASRPVYLTAGVNPALIGAPRRGLAALPSGVVLQLLPPGSEIERRERALTAGSFVAEAIDRLLPLPERLEPEEASIVLSYALAASRAGGLCESLGERTPALRAYEALLRLDPDRLEEEVARDARRIGVEVPKLLLAARTRAGTARLSSATPPGSSH